MAAARQSKKSAAGPTRHRHEESDDGTKGQQTKERLLGATAQLLTEKGYAGTRLGDIARIAEVQVPAIYYYFDSREELIEDVVSRGQHAAREHVEQALAALPEGTSPTARLRCAIEAHLRIVLELPGFTTAAIRNSGQLPDDMRARIQAEHRSYGELWQALFVDAKEAGEIRADLNPTYARLLLLGTLNWSPEWWSPKRGDISEVIEAAIALTNGFAAPSEQ